MASLSRWSIFAPMVLLLIGNTASADEVRMPRGLPAVSPSEAGMDAESLKALTADMQKSVDDHIIAGAVTLVAKQGRVVHLSAVGCSELESKRPMQPDTMFLIASMTKPVTATALMILQDEGKLSIDDPVTQYVPEFAEAKLASGPPSRPITLKDVLTHTSGLGGEQRTQVTLEETIKAIVKRPLDFQPGEKWQYSPGLNVCGRVIEVVAQRPFDEFLKDRVFRPLGMADTTFRPTAAQRSRVARIYQVGDKGELKPGLHWLAEDGDVRAPNPSGGLYSTALDMARFYQMVLNGGELDGVRILSRKAVDQMTTVQSDDLKTGFTDGNGWGLGWCIIRQPQGVTQALSPGTFGHGGAFGTQGWVDPKRNMIFVLMIQRVGLPNSDGSDMRRSLQERAVQAIR